MNTQKTDESLGYVNPDPQEKAALDAYLNSAGALPATTGTASLTTPAPLFNVTQPPPVTPPNVANIPVDTAKPAEPPKIDYVKQLDDLTATLAGRESEKEKRVSGATFGYEQQLVDINKQIQMHQANALQAQKEALDRGETLSFASGEAQRVRFNDAIETLRLSAISESLQGNIALATKHAEAAVNAEFSDKEKQMATIRQNIQDNYDKMSPDQKKKADAALLRLNKEDEFVKQQKEDRKTLQGVAVQAAQNGAPSATINKILAATDLAGAIAAAVGYMDKQTESSIQRYNFAKSPEGGNYTGSYTDFLAHEKSLTPSGSTAGSAEDIADAIITGQMPPDMTKTVSFRDRTAVSAILAKRGFNLSKAIQDWTATQRYLNTLNGAQQTRLRQAVAFSYESLDLVDDLNEEASKILSRAGVNVVNKAEIALAKQGAYGEDARSVATRLDNQISDLISELATVYKGGNSSTDESLKLAANQLSSSWSKKTLTDNVNLIRQNLQIRKNSMENTTVGGIGDSPYNIQNSSIENDINQAIKNPSIFPTREKLAEALAKEYNISYQAALDRVMQIWRDNIER